MNPQKTKESLVNTIGIIIFIIFVFSLFVFLMINNFLLFHIFSEIYAIIIGYTIFTISWVAKDHKEVKKEFLFLGIVYFFVSFLDLFHTLYYKGMNVFKTEKFYATELWIAARYLESLSFLVFSLIFKRIKNLWYNTVFFIYFLITFFLVLSIVEFKIFPECFIEGKGLTDFKIVSEYVICLILLSSIFVISIKEDKKNRSINTLKVSIIFTILSELAFTLYVDVYSIMNGIGHILKIVSFYFVYKAIIRESITNPLNVLYETIEEKIELLENANKNLKYANDTKSKFFSIIAHDILNPLTAMKIDLDFVSKCWGAMQEIEKRGCIKSLVSSTDHIINLLNNLLIWSKMQINGIVANRKSFNLKEVIKKNVELYKPAAHKKMISIFDYSDDVFVNADENMIDTVIRNLINNAVKFTRENGEIKIETSIGPNNEAILVIKDNGIGMSKEQIDNIFRIDTRTHRKGTTGEEGTGLGMILCKDFVEKNGGKLLIESEVEKGTKISVILPTS